MILSMRLHSASDSTLSVPDTQSPNSSKDATAIGFLFAAERYSNFFNARFLVILLMKAENILGLLSGIAFQTAKYVSLTHSSLSS